jgi:undecaprenyl diphosphate synthase
MKQSTLPVPAHVAMIMDGNGRWAERRGKPRWAGHREGARVVRDVVEHCARRGVADLTLYAFSSDNWKRPTVEVAGLLSLFESHFRSEADRLADAGIRLAVIGRRDRLPDSLRRAIVYAESRTAAGTAMTLRVALDYSSRAAIAAMADGAFTPLPPVDLLVRTGGERRLSDFLLWECAYAEFAFIDTHWPDLTAHEIDALFEDFGRRERRFGAAPAPRLSASA